MEFLWAFQLCLDLAMVVGAVWCWKRRYPGEARSSEERAIAYFNVLETKVVEWENEMKKRSALFDEKVALLTKICEKAREVVERKGDQISTLPPSEEEAELRSLSTPLKPATTLEDTALPTVSDLEKEQATLQKKFSGDLKSLFREHLA